MKKIPTVYEVTKSAVLAFNGSFTVNQVKEIVDHILNFDCNRETIRGALFRLKTEGIIRKAGEVPNANGFPLVIFRKS